MSPEAGHRLQCITTVTAVKSFSVSRYPNVGKVQTACLKVWTALNVREIDFLYDLRAGVRPCRYIGNRSTRAAASSGRAPPLPAIVSALPAPKRQPDFTRLGLRDGRNACNPGPRNRRR